MFDELISERGDVMLSSSNQEELIKKYCAGIEYRIRTAPANTEAMRIVDHACCGLENECKSGVVKSFLQQYARRMYEIHREKK